MKRIWKVFSKIYDFINSKLPILDWISCTTTENSGIRGDVDMEQLCADAFLTLPLAVAGRYRGSRSILQATWRGWARIGGRE